MYLLMLCLKMAPGLCMTKYTVDKTLLRQACSNVAPSLDCKKVPKAIWHANWMSGTPTRSIKTMYFRMFKDASIDEFNAMLALMKIVS